MESLRLPAALFGRPTDEFLMAPPPAPRHRHRLLLVEDDEENANIVTELLQLNGFEVHRANDGPSTLKIVRDHEFDAVVLDVLLPGMDGFEVCRQLRADPSTQNLVIVLLTGLDDIPSKLEGLNGGADDYLVKPVTSRELVARIRRRLEARDAGSDEIRKQRLLAIGQLATAICHEINNPLTAALGTLDLVLFRNDITPPVRRELEQIQTALLRISQIISRLDEVEDRTVVYVGADQMIDLGKEE